jgi:hypothetical protein
MRRHLIIILLAMVGLFLGTNGFTQEKKGPGVGDIASFHPEIPQVRLGCCPFTEMKRAMKDNDVRS